MKPIRTYAFLALLAGHTAQADAIRMEDQSQLPPAPNKTEHQTWFQPPLEKDLPKDAFGELIQQGRAIFVDTQTYAAEYVGNGMNCTNCHLDQGRKAEAAPLWGAYTMYPAYRKKNNKVNSYAERIQGCFQFSMNGKAPATDSPVINALTAYSYWMATGAPVGKTLPGRMYPIVKEPEGGYDLAKGQQIYQAQCALCHGDQGEGQAVSQRYVFPPLWGKDSYNWGAGMHRINTAAGFIKANMPLGQGNTLSDSDAWHVAAYINSHERPQDPRLIDGSIEKTREKFHANDGVNLYGQVIKGVLLGQGTQDAKTH